MKGAIAALVMTMSALAGQARAGDALSFERTWLAPGIGTLGGSLEGGYRWNEWWSMRGNVALAGFDYAYHDKDADLINRVSLLSAGVTADYYPFAGDFRVSTGMRLSANKINGELRNLVKHGKNYRIVIADPLTEYTLRQNTVQPYIGTGYSIDLKDRVTLNFDLGALYAGSPDLTVRSRAERFGFTRRQIDHEIERQRNRIAPFQVYPVVQMGLTLRF